MFDELIDQETMKASRIIATSKQDARAMPRRHRRNNSCESLSIKSIAAILESSERLSDLSSSIYSLDTLSSSSSTGDSINESVSASCKSSSTPEIFLSPRPKSKTLNRWDSWAERTPKESPKKPKRDIMKTMESAREDTPTTTQNGLESPRRRLIIVETSRWFSHSESSRTLTQSPRRTVSPSRSRATEIAQQGQDDVLDSPQCPPHALETYLASDKRNANSVQSISLAQDPPNDPPVKMMNQREPNLSRYIDSQSPHAIDPIDCHHNHTRKVISFSSEESKGSFLTCSTCESTESSTMSHNFSIQWCSTDDS